MLKIVCVFMKCFQMSFFSKISYDTYVKRSNCSFIGTGDKNCTDPEILYNDVVVDPKEYIYQLQYRTSDLEWSPTYDYNMHPETWTIRYGPRTYGKCFTPVLDPEMTKKGINRINIRTKGDMRFYNTFIILESFLLPK